MPAVEQLAFQLCMCVRICRCLDTASIVLADMKLSNVNTEELIRETLGSDTCDARRSVSDPPGGGKPDTGPCAFDRGLKAKYPVYDFPGTLQYASKVSVSRTRLTTMS